MHRKIALSLAFLLLLAPWAEAAPAPPEVSAKSYAVVEQSSGRLIAGRDVNTRRPMASTTKIMTGLLAVESGKLDNTVTVPAEALKVEGSSMGLVAGEKITLRDLVYGLMLESGNDAANVIAVYLGGTAQGFVDQMNAKAAVLGLTGTHFANPSGLDAKDHYTTAYDLARLGAYAMCDRTFAQIAGTRRISVTYNGSANARKLVNHNRLLGELAGVTGVKTGFTKKCGRCLVSSATRGGVSLVVSTLNDPRDWDDHEKLLDYAFSLLKSCPVLPLPQGLKESVVGGTMNKVAVNFDQTFSAALLDGEAPRLQTSVQMPKFTYAPVKAGQKLGYLVATVDGKIVAKTPLTAAAAVPQQVKAKPSGGLSGFFKAILGFFKKVF